MNQRGLATASSDLKRKAVTGMSEVSAQEQLLIDVKNYLDITWTDEATDKKVNGIVLRGIKYLDRKAGVELDYSVEDQPRELLFEYCRYVRSNALNEFETNYLHELLDLQISKEVENYAESSTDV